MAEAFRHADRDQTIVFGDGALDSAEDLIGDDYDLLTTPRAARAGAAIVDRAACVVHVPAGAVDEVAGRLLDTVGRRRLVALGGGRVIDTAKAVAAAKALSGPVAIPTTLSGAEMTGVHRHARGVPDATPRSRASVVINDPALSASQPPEQLAASAANALGHAITALTSSRSTPIARAVAHDAVRCLVRGCAAEPDRPQVALGSLLAGWAVDRSGLGPHHALSQTAVRIASLEHAQANAVLLPHTIRALRSRVPDVFDALDDELGTALEDVARELVRRASVVGLGAIELDDTTLARMTQVAARRPELARVPEPMARQEIREIYLASISSRHRSL